MNLYSLLLGGLGIVLLSLPVAGQGLLGVQASGQAAMQEVTQVELGLLNGPEYVNLAPTYVVGSPFYLSDLPQRGAIAYDGNYFARVPLRYEQSLDQVVLFDSVRGVHIQLIREKVDFFELAGHRFVRLAADSSGQLAAGFYELLLAGPAQLLARQSKQATKSSSARSITGEFFEQTRFFVQQGGRYTEVANLGQLLQAFASRRAQVQQFVRSNHLKFRAADRAASLTAVVRYYNSLTPSE